MKVLRAIVVVALISSLALLIGGCASGAPADRSEGTPVEAKQGSPGPSESGASGSTAKSTAKSTDENTTIPAPVDKIGDAAQLPDYRLRVLDVVESEDWFYPDTSNSQQVDATSMAGKFVTVWYAVKNTGRHTITHDLEATLAAGGQFFESSQEVQHPRSWATELAPNDVMVAAFVFDVPRDAKPESLTIGANIGYFDLTRANLEKVAPEEILALSWEYVNMGDAQLAYELYSTDAQAQVTQEQYAAGTAYYTKEPIIDYAFPSVEISGNRATVERVYTYYSIEDFATGQDRATQPLVREDGVWHIEFRPEQIEYFTKL